LVTSPDGLPTGEVAARQALYGRNVLHEEKEVPAWRKVWPFLVHPLSGILLLAGGLAVLVGEPVLGLTIWVLIFVNAGFSFWREHRTEQAMLALRQLLPAHARLIRDGSETSVLADEIVPGDVLVLAEGDSIPADARVVEASGLRINNAILTGESIPARKTADASLGEGFSEVERANLVFAGTSVVSGTGRAVVYSTGMLTQFGRIAHLTQVVQQAPSRFQLELTRLTRLISILALAAGVIVFIVGAFEIGLETDQAFLWALGLIVAAVPEGLPAILTLTLAMAGQRLAQRGVLIKKLAVIETLGTVSTICTDKSGTLTQNQMTVKEIWLNSGDFRVTGGGYQPQGEIIPRLSPGAAKQGLDLLLSAALLCNNSRLSPPSADHPRWTALGDQTEAAMRVAALKGRIDEEGLLRDQPRIHELPFDARRKRMSTIHQLRLGGQLAWLEEAAQTAADPAGFSGQLAFVKGAPREVLQLCTQLLHGGQIQPLDERARAETVAAIDRYARQGLRVLGLACRLLPHRAGVYTPESVERDLIFLGLMAMHDPPRPEVAQAVRTCRGAGIRMVMITGDYGLTAESLARRVGMLSSKEALIVTGAEIDAMSDDELSALLVREVVFARMAPEHKLRLVSAFQAHGEVVAVTGDGVNDAPALKKADIGVAMGVTGTDVAKEAADLVLVNDNFATITAAIEEGRAVYDNLRKFMIYIFSSNVPEMLPFILSALLGIHLALTVPQILLIDLGTDILPALALGTEKPEPDILDRQPRRPNQPLIDRSLLRRAFLWLGPIEAVLAYSGFYLVYSLTGRGLLDSWINTSGFDQALQAILPAGFTIPSDALLAGTVFLAGVVMAQVGNAFACRSEVNRGRKLGWLANRFLIAGVLAEVGLILTLIYFPPFAAAFDLAPLPGVLWLWVISYPIILYGLEWIRKSILRKSRQNGINKKGMTSVHSYTEAL
jgi:magnesium-transporting ATPase (P-type)